MTADLQSAVQRVLSAWDTTTLKINGDGMLSEAMESLRAEFDASLQAPAEAHGDVLVPLTVLEDASSSLGHYLSDLGWSDEDMQAMDNLDAYIARHKANAAAQAAHSVDKSADLQTRPVDKKVNLQTQGDEPAWTSQPQIVRNLLESCANWLESRSHSLVLHIQPDPEEGGGYASLMREYAKNLRELNAVLTANVQPKGTEPPHERVKRWAEKHHITFVSRSHGLASTETISFAALEALALAQAPAPAHDRKAQALALCHALEEQPGSQYQTAAVLAAFKVYRAFESIEKHGEIRQWVFDVAAPCAAVGAEPVRYPHPDEDDPVTLWKEIRRLRAAMSQAKCDCTAYCGQYVLHGSCRAHPAPVTISHVPVQHTAAPEPIRCPERLKNGGTCPHHNLQCGWPACNKGTE